ncbi:hypothetical protein J3U09_05670 [Gilliamella sp. B2889]|uniref:hypothetical protein n=1 Tax=Gilliamella sp. B2889 TaxID=2817985 RepID=UPI00226AD707|nr:hypothetical protein [Gilliamella sp. B2889]MCX8683211.1 hypothetical protein [Gilliamella sp. B2889]
MKKITSCIFIICLIIPNILFADDRNKSVELRIKVFNEHKNITTCIWGYASEQIKKTQHSSEQIAFEAIVSCDDVIEKMRLYNREYIKLAYKDNLRSKGLLLYSAEKQLWEQKQAWINNIQNYIDLKRKNGD